MVIKGKLLIGPILSLIGGIIFIFSSFLFSEKLIAIGYILSDAGLFHYEVGLYPELLIIGFVCTIVWGALGIIGGSIAIFYKKFGSVMALNGGILGLIGALIPLGTNIAVTQIPITLTGSFFFLDPILLILGGILGLVLKK
ncbi:MAG: hypothetical protein HWN80_04140 [Candidatus Lokiarchaeota archaeon]|nr:hypothetical protein [Candidatus Lokiarchaeota archaeon]